MVVLLAGCAGRTNLQKIDIEKLPYYCQLLKSHTMSGGVFSPYGDGLIDSITVVGNCDHFDILIHPNGQVEMRTTGAEPQVP